jgi:hypothetical protein
LFFDRNRVNPASVAIGRIAASPWLRERDAADIIHALWSPELYRLLAIERGWTAGRYEQWLAKAHAAQLLPAPAS